jgi:hypothetical protein
MVLHRPVELAGLIGQMLFLRIPHLIERRHEHRVKGLKSGINPAKKAISCSP